VPAEGGAPLRCCLREVQGVIAELLARPEVVLVHLRNVGYGCYNFCVRAHGG